MAKSRLKKFFLTGLITLLPTILTVFIIVLCFNLLNNYFGKPIGRLILMIIEFIGGTDNFFFSIFGQNARELSQNDTFLTIIGLPIAILVTFTVGVLIASFLGKRLMIFLETVIENLPVIKVIYPYAKQFTDFFKPAGQKKTDFKKVVAVEYPRKGIYSIGFITSDGLKQLCDKTGKRCNSVFIPSSPTPFTGYLIYVPEEELIELEITVDEALPLFISGGVLTPQKEDSK